MNDFDFVNDNVCPYCGSSDIHGTGVGWVYDNDSIVDAQVCNACGKRLWFIYKPVRVEDEYGHAI